MARKPTSTGKAANALKAPPASFDVPVVPAVEPIAPAPPSNIVNNTSGHDLHYGDGRRLKPGETAEVSHELAAIWRRAGFIA